MVLRHGCGSSTKDTIIDTHYHDNYLKIKVFANLKQVGTCGKYVSNWIKKDLVHKYHFKYCVYLLAFSNSLYCKRKCI